MTTSFVEKYRPKDYKEIVGQAKAVEIIKKFLEEFPKKKALVLYGPAGTGKTSIVLAAAKENNYEIMELNSSDLRNRQKLEETLKPASEQKSLFKKSKIILMDEVDGVTGTDIGGIPELVRVIQTTRFPIIMTCNDVWQSKLSPVREKSIIIELKPLDLGTIVSVLAQVAEKENVKKDSPLSLSIFLNILNIVSSTSLFSVISTNISSPDKYDCKSFNAALKSPWDFIAICLK